MLENSYTQESANDVSVSMVRQVCEHPPLSLPRIPSFFVLMCLTFVYINPRGQVTVIIYFL